MNNNNDIQETINKILAGLKEHGIEKACKDIFPEGENTDWTADEDLMSFLETLV